MRIRQALGLSRRSSFALSWSNNVPSDLSSDDDSFGLYSKASDMLLPNTDIASLDSAFSVGVFLWCMLYYILAKDVLLSVLARAMRYEESPFFEDFKDNYAYNVPFDVEVLRVLVIGLLATATTSATSFAFDGDLYWGWAISGALLFPSTLFYLAQEKRPSRAEGELMQGLSNDFSMFKDESIVYRRGSAVDIDRIVLLFRRRHVKYRDEDVVTDKAIKKVVRRVLGKGIDGVYADLELVSRMKEGRKQLEANIAKARERATAVAAEEEQEAEAMPETEGTEFMR